MYIFVYIVTYSILADSANLEKVVSDEEIDAHHQMIRKAGRSEGYPMPRRFLDDLNDYDFHISHLKDPEFDSGRRHCKTSFEERVKRYKKMLASDGSRVEFVSADPLPVDEKDLLVEDKCEEVSEELKVLENKNNSSMVGDKKKTYRATEEKIEIKDTATTPNIDIKSHEAKMKKRAEDEKRRASTYQFSSVEYYDEVPDFDSRVCPDDVEVVRLQQDVIKPYDVECELMLRWESFKD